MRCSRCSPATGRGCSIPATPTLLRGGRSWSTRAGVPGRLRLRRDLSMTADAAAEGQARCSLPRCPAGRPRARATGEARDRRALRRALRDAHGLHPKGDRPYLFGLHQCSRPRSWTKEEQRLFEEIGHRLHRRAGEPRSRSAACVKASAGSKRQQIAHVGWWERDFVAGRAFFR